VQLGRPPHRHRCHLCRLELRRHFVE
jgi:hypothetical protein